METYKYSEGYRGPRTIPPETVMAELQKLRASKGTLTSAGVVEAARPEGSPLHGAFVWNDADAAREYRLIQARTLIRSVVVIREVVVDGEKQETSDHVFVHIPDATQAEGKYVLIAEVAAVENELVAALAEAQRRLDSARQAVSELMDVATKRGGATEALAIALQGFSTVREALAMLRV